MKSPTPASPLRLRLRRFCRLRRGYYSFLILFGAYALTFFLPFFMNNRAILVRYQGRYYFPAAKSALYDIFGIGQEYIHLGSFFSQIGASGALVYGEADYRALKRQFAAEKTGNFVLLPPIPYHPNEQFLELAGHPPHPPSASHWLGTDDRGRDVLVRLSYGFWISISFALLVVTASYIMGILVGALLGYYGRWFDIIGQRLVEIWGAIPFLYTVIILASIFQPSFSLLVIILAVFGWMQITYYVRGEFYRERTKDYVAAAVAVGETNTSIIVKHILPNTLTPIITFAPFAIVTAIVSLVSLDFLGFGLSPPTPSWGEMLSQAKQNLQVWHLVVYPLGSMFITLQLVVFVGEAVREAFDPKVYSRLH